MPTLKEIWLMPFNAIGKAAGLFMRNRKRIHELARRPRAAAFVRYGATIILLIWLALAFFSSEKGDNRLTDAVKSLWSTGKVPAPEPPPAAPPQQ